MDMHKNGIEFVWQLSMQISYGASYYLAFAGAWRAAGTMDGAQYDGPSTEIHISNTVKKWGGG